MNKKLMAFLLGVIALTVTLVSLSARDTVTSAQDAKAFVGTWERIAYKDDNGQAVEDRLVRANLIFGADGNYSQVQLPRGREYKNKPLKELTKEELLNRFEGAAAYYGAYTVTGNTLTRKMRVNLNPNAEGTVLTQEFRFEGDLLILTRGKAEARFQRVK